MTRFNPLSLLLFAALFVITSGLAKAQQAAPFKATYHDGENNTTLYLDLDSASITAPGYDFLGPMNGYMRGNLQCMWFVVSHKTTSPHKATITLANELGSDSQKAELTTLSPDSIELRLIDPIAIKRVVNKKLVKSKSTMHFRRR